MSCPRSRSALDVVCGDGRTHELVSAKDGFTERGELDGRHGDLPEAVVLHAGSAEGSCDDLVTKADAWVGAEMDK